MNKKIIIYIKLLIYNYLKKYNFLIFIFKINIYIINFNK
jgi:hypothetical protein